MFNGASLENTVDLDIGQFKQISCPLAPVARTSDINSYMSHSHCLRHVNYVVNDIVLERAINDVVVYTHVTSPGKQEELRCLMCATKQHVTVRRTSKRSYVHKKAA